MAGIDKQYREKLREKQGRALRDPAEIIAGEYKKDGLVKQSLFYKTTGDFVKILDDLKMTLIVSREYENLLMALTVKDGKLEQSFVHIPHPSGLVIDREKKLLYVAATRNPNQIWEFKPTNYFIRNDTTGAKDTSPYLMPIRTKFYAGSYYYHELALIGNRLYADSVGRNGIIEVGFKRSLSEDPVWWPKCIEERGKPNHKANYIQLNSIAAGKSLKSSYFTAFSASDSKTPRNKRPWRRKRPPIKKGVLFSGKTREVCAEGLTHPHSARFYGRKVWLANSGFGEIGYVKNGNFVATMDFPGWTRGLRFIGDICFVGLSRLLPKYYTYAPGVNPETSICGVYAVDMKKNIVVGSIVWPYGNQIFSLDWLDCQVSRGFAFKTIAEKGKRLENIFYSYKIV